ncbi:nucleoside triphosphate pyrophosphohydrolase [Agreia sp. PsM10]|uniref:nucleoside triphosphate pyrophosphohydrolase n=1 Tax=Agreia sp. PsM10 TaxID=3030533 RepID=UPI00263B9702|nr:nucleoside triphosphate pyrophosphohydrolase [Agreia sp. PsM10]MDN4639930.1 nucleoside triphosphate pyrophosphohydrolase [Agreia sp. PsM10]
MTENTHNPRSLFLSSPSLSANEFRLAEVSEAGGKGAGLLRLSPNWYPETLIVGPHAHRMYRAGDITATFASDSEDRERLEHVLSRMTSHTSSKRIFVRSSAAREGVSERGKYESVTAEASAASMQESIVAMWKSVGLENDLGVVVQPFINVKVRGHLSNEHRVSRDTTSWVSEMFVGNQGTTQTWRVTGAVPAGDGALMCPNVRSIEKVLRGAAKLLSGLPFRHHLEWVWDGERIWVVQADRVPPTTGNAPGDAWSARRGESIDQTSLNVWAELSGDVLADSTGWDKAGALRKFSDSGLPVARVWILEGAQIINSLNGDEVVPGLVEDLALLASGHIVVRTDVRGAGAQLMLPKTGTESDPVAIEAFLRQTCSSLIAAGVGPENIAFLAHRYLRARACAWSLAYPDQAFVEIDSMWGTPDGLAWLPHDSAWANVDTGEVWRSIEGKTNFLDIDEHGTWTYRESPTEWIWRASMSEDQIRNVAAGASRLAKQAGAPVLTMWFIGILEGADAEYLPWFQQIRDADEADVRGSISPAKDRRTVTTTEELDSVGRDAGPSFKVLRIVPGPDLVRDKDFVTKVIEVATSRDLTVELVGSPLAHPYYLIRRAGVAVSCVSQFEQPLTIHNKLVRDNIVDQIESNGEVVVSYRAAGTERTRLLRLKLVEESLELLRAATTEQATDEIADVEEVLDSLRVALRVRRSDVRERRAEKRTVRGGFDEGLVLVSAGRQTSDSDNELDGFDDAGPSRRPWQVQQHLDKIILSALPPVAGEQQTYVLKLGDRSVRIVYRGARIEISQEGETKSEPGDELLFLDL